MKISVVIPTYKRTELLRRALKAIQAQTYAHRDFEVIVISDGPDPATEVLVRETAEIGLGLQTRFHSLATKCGPAAARNAGWRISRGKLVVFTDDDCIPDPFWLEAYQHAYDFQYTGEPICFTGRVDVPLHGVPTDYEKNVWNLATAEFVTANCACSRSALDLVGGFDEAFPIAWREDSDLQFRLLQFGISISYVPEALVCHPVRKARWGISIFDQRKSMFNALLFKKHPDLYRKRIASHPVWFYYIIILFTFISALGLVFGVRTVFMIGTFSWLAAITSFTTRRLHGTDTSLSHLLEMVVTSIVIPYLSVYWTLRGAWRYKVFFL